MRIEGTTEATRMLGELAARLRDPAPALRAEVALMRDAAVRSIESRVAPDGSRWPEPRRTTTSGRGGRRATARPSSRRTGRLASSGRASTDGQSAVLEFTAPYAGYVQDSGRAFVPFVGDEPQLEAGSLAGLSDRVGDWLVGGVL